MPTNASWSIVGPLADVHTTIMSTGDFEALKKDAARYRWLRGSPLDRGKCFSFDGLSLKCGADLDAAIDATMGKD